MVSLPFLMGLVGAGLVARASSAKPGVGYFEDWVRYAHTSFEAVTQPTTLDLRIAKARGGRGYGKARISVRSHAPLANLNVSGPLGSVQLSSSEPFRYKWRA